MKKLSLFFVSALAFVITTISCNSDNDNVSLTGKWEISKDGVVVDGKEILSAVTNEGGCQKEAFEFKEGGNFINHYSEYSDSKCNDYVENGSWTKKDNLLTIIYEDDDSETAEILTLNQNTLKIKYTHQYNGQVVEIYVAEFIRK